MASDPDGTGQDFQDVARIGYADMLHDEDRNDAYYNAIKKTIERLSHGVDTLRVIDIGTGKIKPGLFIHHLFKYVQRE